MEEILCYKLYEAINNANFKHLFLKKIETGEETGENEFEVNFIYHNNISYLNLRKVNIINYYDEDDQLLDCEHEVILNLSISRDDIVEVEMCGHRIMIKTKLFIIELV